MLLTKTKGVNSIATVLDPPKQTLSFVTKTTKTIQFPHQWC